MIEYRAAALAELPFAAALRREMALEMGSDYDAQRVDWQARFCVYFGGKQCIGNAEVFLAFDGDEPIGMTTVSLSDEWRAFCFETRFAFVNAVYVRPEYRRRGIGRVLMQSAIEWARRRGCSRLRLRTSDEGRALYESLGFQPGREMEKAL